MVPAIFGAAFTRASTSSAIRDELGADVVAELSLPGAIFFLACSSMSKLSKPMACVV